MTLNPAETGFFKGGKYRFTANFRNQWSFVPFPYSTYSASFEWKIAEAYMSNNDDLATGMCIFNDRAGKGNIHTSGALGSVAFHKDFYGGVNVVALGIQTGVLQIGFDPNVLVFGDQIERQGTNGKPSTNEVFDKTNVSYVDVNVGALWNFIPSERINIYTGLNASHLNSPKISFLDGANVLSKRISFYGAAAFDVNEMFDVLPAFLFLKQKASSELYLGSAVRYKSNEETAFRLGLWYRNSRNSDAMVIMTGLDFGTMKAGLSYDINVSKLSSASKGNGAFELSLLYVVGMSNRKAGGSVRCPSF